VYAPSQLTCLSAYSFNYEASLTEVCNGWYQSRRGEYQSIRFRTPANCWLDATRKGTGDGAGCRCRHQEIRHLNTQIWRRKGAWMSTLDHLHRQSMSRRVYFTSVDRKGRAVNAALTYLAAGSEMWNADWWSFASTSDKRQTTNAFRFREQSSWLSSTFCICETYVQKQFNPGSTFWIYLTIVHLQHIRSMSKVWIPSYFAAMRSERRVTAARTVKCVSSAYAKLMLCLPLPLTPATVFLRRLLEREPKKEI